MSKSGTIIIVDDNKGVLTAVEIFAEKLFFKGRHTFFTCHPHHCDAGRNAGSDIVGYELHFGNQYR